MKGEVFNIFEAFITEGWSEEKYEEIFEAISPQLATQEPFVGPGTYPDEDFLAIVGQAVDTLGVPLPEAVHAFGKFSFSRLAKKVPDIMAQHSHPKEFLKCVHDVIHVEVRKVMKDAEPPEFEFEDPAPNQMVLIYRSKRKLYDFLEGLLEGASEYFKIPIDYQREVLGEGPEEFARFHLTFG